MDTISYQTFGWRVPPNLDTAEWNLTWVRQVVSHIKTTASLKAVPLKTPLGTLLALSDEHYLYGLYFSERPVLQIIQSLSRAFNLKIRSEETLPIASIQRELTLYFSGHLPHFETPIQLCGSAFQRKAWEALRKVPYGMTKSYTEQAITMGVSKTYRRAVANANHANPIAIVVPCHRIIRSNGNLSGYAGGVARKRWLLLHEQKK